MATKNSLLERLIPYLLINYSTISGCGLMNGKMGGVIFFALYAKKTGIPFYNDYSNILFEDIFKRLNVKESFGFSNGLCGIGWGVEYLIRNGFSEGNTDEILEEIDNKIMEWDPCHISDKSFMTGIGGVIFYVTTRLQSIKREKDYQPFDKDYLYRLKQAIDNKKIMERSDIPTFLNTEFNDVLNGISNYGIQLSLPRIMFDNLPEDFYDLTKHPVWISKGLTGIALKLLLQ